VTYETDNPSNQASPGVNDIPGAPQSPGRVTLGALVDRIEHRVTASIHEDIEHAMVAITAIRNSVEAVAGTVRRMDERMTRLEQVLGAAATAQSETGGALAVAESGLVAAHLAQLERRLVEVDDRAAQEILDAIVAVAQHLEAVQTATAWAIVREMRTG
jgi:hypothetical protein